MYTAPGSKSVVEAVPVSGQIPIEGERMNALRFSRLGGSLAIACLAPVLLAGFPSPTIAQQTNDSGSASPNLPAGASPDVVPIPADVDCAVKGLDLVETANGWIAKEATGLSCSISGRGPAGIKTVEFLSKALINGIATTKEFGEVTFTVNGVPPGGGTTLPNGGRVTEVESALTEKDEGFLTIALHPDQMSAFRAYLSAPTPFEASVASCSAGAAAAWPPNVKIKKQETIWRIVDLGNCSVHYTQAIDLDVQTSAGMFMTFSGTITLTPNRMQSGVSAHVTSLDAWKVPVSIPGTFANIRGQVSGMAMLIGGSDGGAQQEQPQIHGGEGFLAVIFKDIGDKKKVRVASFIADTVASDAAAAPVLKD
jgi:hypothetical protein